MEVKMDTILKDYTNLPIDLFPVILKYCDEIYYYAVVKIIYLMTKLHIKYINDNLINNVMNIIDNYVEFIRSTDEKDIDNLAHSIKSTICSESYINPTDWFGIWSYTNAIVLYCLNNF
jgi:hypothetical protein